MITPEKGFGVPRNQAITVVFDASRPVARNSKLSSFSAAVNCLTTLMID